MSQNIYDNPEFFAGYATLDRSVKRDSTARQNGRQYKRCSPLFKAKIFLIWAVDMVGFAATRAIIRQPA